jgi:hypothetical protein
MQAAEKRNLEMQQEIRLRDQLSIGNQFAAKGFFYRPFQSKYAGPSFKRFPRFTWPLLLFVRNLKVYLAPKRIEGYTGDAIITRSIMSFLESDNFKRSYARMRIASREVNDPGLHFRVHQILWAVQNCFSLDGDFVECGSGRGMMMSAALESLEEWNSSQKKLFLCDTFEPFGINPLTGQNDSRFGKRDTYAYSIEDVKLNFEEWNNIYFVIGQIPETLPFVDTKKIAFLHIDLNHPAAEVDALRFFWPQLLIGGIVVLDDYAQDQSQNQAMNQLALEIGASILTTGTGQGIIIKG